MRIEMGKIRTHPELESLPFIGSVGKMIVDDQEVSLEQISNACSENLCWNNGTCYQSEIDAKFSCECKSPFTGELCQLPAPLICVSGEEVDCVVGYCDKYGRCICPLGREGGQCEYEEKISKDVRGISFNGQTSFLVIDSKNPFEDQKLEIAKEGQRGLSVGK